MYCRRSWAESTSGCIASGIKLVADGNGDFTKAFNQAKDATGSRMVSGKFLASLDPILKILLFEYTTHLINEGSPLHAICCYYRYIIYVRISEVFGFMFTPIISCYLENGEVKSLSVDEKGMEKSSVESILKLL